MSDQSLESVLLKAFAIESGELLARLTSRAAQFDRGTTHPRELLQHMSIDLHTLTGAASTAGLETVSLLCQALEDFVDELAHGNRQLDRPAIESLRRAFRLLDDACSGGPTTELWSVLHNLRITPGWQPRGMAFYPVEQPPAAGHDHDPGTSVATTSPAESGNADDVGLDTRACALRFQFTALHAAWQQLHDELSAGAHDSASRADDSASRADIDHTRTADDEMAPCADRLSEFAAQFDAAMDSLHELTEAIARADVGAATDTPSIRWVASDQADAREGKRILVVDDSRTARTWVRDLLESAGYTVYLATDGQEALEIIPSLSHLDLLVTDLKMPRMDGATLCQRVRDLDKFAFMPIVIVTSQSDDRNIETGLMAGANAYVVKQDLGEDRFLQTVERLLH